MKQQSRNSHFSGTLKYTGKNQVHTQIQFIQYGENSLFEKKTNDILEINSLINDQTISWIRVTGLNDPELVISLAKSFGLNHLEVKDVLTIQQIIRMEEYADKISMVLPSMYYNEKNAIISDHVAFLLGKNYVISFQEYDYPLFESILQAIRNNTLKIKSRKSDFLLASLLYEVISNYSDCVTQLEDSLEELEGQLLDIKKYHKNQMAVIQKKRRNMIQIRKQLLPFKDQFTKLLRSDSTLIDPREVPFSKDIYKQLLYCLQTLESCREIMSSLVDLYLNNNDVKMNVVMKQLTSVATIFIPLTFIVGVWGMNFKVMPELDWKYGYLFAWALMIASGFAVWKYLRKKDWF